MGNVPEVVAELVERFGRNAEAYRSTAYNEEQLRGEFINPFWKALGWDVDNVEGRALAYREVVQEEALPAGGGSKAPDYGFRIGGMRKFFVEAKRPGVSVKDAPEPAYQLRRYAWSAKLPLSVLTDFEEFAVYDCTVRPNQTDKASAARILYVPYTEYAERWEEIAGVFSREAVLKGDFDRFAKVKRPRRGTTQVDAELLKEIEHWREELARNFALRNPGLSVRDLNLAVQKTIDRIIFLRMCEDRGIEDAAQLQGLLAGPRIYPRLVQVYRQADQKYNSGLFHFEAERDRAEPPDELTPTLSVDDKVLKDIITRLYYPDSPYEFSVLPVEILGNVYEQFLGKVIRLTAGHRAKVEEKPEVRKAGGVYYTPKYIVDYIVKNTVGKLLEGKTVAQAGELRILDPACGSGSFLLGAYQSLLDWHRDRYVEEMGKTGKVPTVPTGGNGRRRRGDQPALFEGPGGEWRLTTAERKRILLNNIYGVDIDVQAVEVTKLSLLLKVLERENRETLARQLRIFRERALPDLGRNIRCGNSLIGPDFFQGRQMSLLDEEEVYRLNPFDWNDPELGFGEIMKAGGFDAVIGNPPYIRMETFKEQKAYLKANFACHDERSDLYAYFIERAHSRLKVGGRFGMIVSNKFLRAKYGLPLRDFLRKSATVERVVDFAGLPVFQGATVRTIILLTSVPRKDGCQTVYSAPVSADVFQVVEGGSLPVDQAIAPLTYGVSSDALAAQVWSFGRQETDDLMARLRACCLPLGEYCEGQICMGVKCGLMEAFVIDAEARSAILNRDAKSGEVIKPFLNGRDVRRYYIDAKGLYLIYTYHGVKIGDYPGVEEHLRPFKAKLERRATRQAWYELQQPQRNFAGFMDGRKIIFPDIATRPRFALDETGSYGANTTYVIPRPDLYLLGLLNSGLAYRYFSTTCAGLEGKKETYLRFFGEYLEGFPVHQLDLLSPAQVKKHDRMVELVERMLELHRRKQQVRTPEEKTMLERQIAATDREIDELVYELYGLTEEEIRIVEEGSR